MRLILLQKESKFLSIIFMNQIIDNLLTVLENNYPKDRIVMLLITLIFLFFIPVFGAEAQLYANEFKSWEFGKEAAQIFVSGTSDHCWIARRE
jgi:hypothetical protein